jgi:DNA-binding transcriptional regulator YiaG
MRMAAKRRTDTNLVWDAARVKALRDHLGLTQQQLAEELSVRQQTISEWEQGVYQPRRSSCKLLTMFATEAGFGVKSKK